MSSTDPLPNTVGDYLCRLEQECQEAQQDLAALCPQLAELGVQEVEIVYDGCSDSGTIDEVTARAGERQIELPPELCEALSDAAATLLPCGWEINDGAFGRFVLDVARKQVRREHNWRVMSAEYEEETIDL